MLALFSTYLLASVSFLGTAQAAGITRWINPRCTEAQRKVEAEAWANAGELAKALSECHSSSSYRICRIILRTASPPTCFVDAQLTCPYLLDSWKSNNTFDDAMITCKKTLGPWCGKRDTNLSQTWAVMRHPPPHSQTGTILPRNFRVSHLLSY